MSIMRGGIMRGANNIPYLRIRERTWTELMALDPAAEVGRVYAINDWGTRCYFESDGTYWRPHNGTMLLHKWDLSGLSTSQTAQSSVAGFTSPVFPWNDLLAVPGFSLTTNLSFTRTSPASSQSLRAVVRFSGELINLCFLDQSSTHPGGRSTGRNEYASSTQITDSPSGSPYGSTLSSFSAVTRPANSAVDLLARTGDTGGTEVMQFRTLQVVYSA